MASSDGVHAVVLVCEGPADERTLRTLVDRGIIERIAWIEGETIASFRAFSSPDVGDSCLKWSRIGDVAKRLGIKMVHGHFRGGPGALYSQAARKALLTIERSLDCGMVVMVCDDKVDGEFLEGLKQAKDENPWPFAVAIGVAKPMREAWVLAAFEPRDAERERLAALARELSLDPCGEPHRLGHRKDHEPRNPKRVLGVLLDGSPEREDECLRTVSRERLVRKGDQTGLLEFLGELERSIDVCFGATRPGRSA